MNLTTLGIDLAKTAFSLVGMDKNGKVILHKIEDTHYLTHSTLTLHA